MHVLTAAHCIDGKKDVRGDRNYELANEWEDNKYIWVGTHKKMQIDNVNDPHGQKLERDKAWGLERITKRVIKFPIYPDIYSGREIQKDHLIDIAVIQVKVAMMFHPGHVEKARLDSPSSNCKTCSNDCDFNKIFKAVGWGQKAKGIYHISQLFLFTSTPYIQFSNT